MDYILDKPLYGTIGLEKYQCSIEWRNGKFLADEPVKAGGKDLGPDPHTLLLSSIASCTLITLRMYIDRKGWIIPAITVNTNLFLQTTEGKKLCTIDQDILFPGPVTDEQKTRLQQIAAQCPISKILESEIRVRTFVFRNTDTKEIHYENEEFSVVWKPGFCQHSARCWTQLPEVFDPKIKKWINPDGAPAGKIEQQVKKCPSGALGFINKKNPK